MTRTRVHFHHSLYQWWGLPSRYLQLVQHLDPDRFNCTTVGAADVFDSDSMPDWQKQLTDMLAPALQRTTPPWHNLNDLAAEAASHDMCHSGKVDIVHFLDGEHSAPYLAQMIHNRLPKVCSIATFHQPPSLAEKVIQGAALRHLDAIILMVPSQVPFFSRFVPPDRIHVILHGVDTAFFTPGSAPRSPGPLRCITTGLHLRDWDAFHAVALARPGIDFTVVTSGRLELRPLPNVRVLSGLTDVELAAAYRDADVLFLPLQDATANNSLLEGMASGLAVLSTDLPAVRAYAPDGAGFLIADNAVPAFVTALDQLAQDQAMRRRMGNAARNRAEELAWTLVAQQYEAIYEKCLQQPRRALPMATAPLPAIRPYSATPQRPTQGQRPDSALHDFMNLARWGEHLRGLGLTDEATIIVHGLSQNSPGSAATACALAAEAEAEWHWNEAALHWEDASQACGKAEKGRMLARKAIAQARGGAFTLARQSLATDGKSPDARLAAALIATEFSSASEALSSWAAFTRNFPDQGQGFIGHARLLMRQARFDEADALLGHVTQVWPESPALAALWAQVADDRQELQQAEARWRQVLVQHGTAGAFLAPYARHLGLTRLSSDIPEALSDWALDEEEMAEALLHAYAATGDWGPAAMEARHRVQQRPDNLGFRQRLAEVLERLGTSQARAEALAILIDLHGHAPDATAVLAPLARAMIANGRVAEAASLIKQIPSDRSDLGAELLRTWLRLHTSGETGAVNYWHAVVLGFGLPWLDLE